MSQPRRQREEDRQARRIAHAWVNADFAEKLSFVIHFADEVGALLDHAFSADHEGKETETKSHLIVPRRGPQPYTSEAKAPIEPIEKAIRAGLSVSEIARRLGVAYNTVNRWRHGHTQPTPAMMAKIKKTLPDSMDHPMRSSLY